MLREQVGPAAGWQMSTKCSLVMPAGALLAMQWRRWVPEGGMQMLTGSSRWFRCGAWEGVDAAAFRVRRTRAACSLPPPQQCMQHAATLACHGNIVRAPLLLICCSREEVVRKLRKDHSISTRIARRHAQQQKQQQEQQRQEHQQEQQEEQQLQQNLQEA